MAATADPLTDSVTVSLDCPDAGNSRVVVGIAAGLLPERHAVVAAVVVAWRSLVAGRYANTAVSVVVADMVVAERVGSAAEQAAAGELDVAFADVAARACFPAG